VSRSDRWKYAPAMRDDKAEDLAGSFFAQIFAKFQSVAHDAQVTA
jgi:hypothetical protein